MVSDEAKSRQLKSDWSRMRDDNDAKSEVPWRDIPLRTTVDGKLRTTMQDLRNLNKI